MNQNHFTPLHPQALVGLELFNQGAYFEAHEALETAWREESGPTRDLYRGILQVAVAYHHILRGNYPGAIKLFQRCRQWLAPFPNTCNGINLLQFRQDFEHVEAEILRLGPQGIVHFSPNLLKAIQYNT